jgi:hypothetical protein
LRYPTVQGSGKLAGAGFRHIRRMYLFGTSALYIWFITALKA